MQNEAELRKAAAVESMSKKQAFMNLRRQL
jgi:hypothetical protein